jgi:hypothetical protein
MPYGMRVHAWLDGQHQVRAVDGAVLWRQDVGYGTRVHAWLDGQYQVLVVYGQHQVYAVYGALL